MKYNLYQKKITIITGSIVNGAFFVVFLLSILSLGVFFYGKAEAKIPFSMVRGIYGFDTSAIPDTDIINSATFSLYATTIVNSNNQSIVIDRKIPATATALVASDYNIAGWAAVEQATRVAVTSLVTSTYNDFILNTTGLGNISKTGITWLGTRYSSDFDNSVPAIQNTEYITWNMADSSGSSTDPKLVVVHTAAVPSSGAIFNKEIIFGRDVIFK